MLWFDRQKWYTRVGIFLLLLAGIYLIGEKFPHAVMLSWSCVLIAVIAAILVAKRRMNILKNATMVPTKDHKSIVSLWAILVPSIWLLICWNNYRRFGSHIQITLGAFWTFMLVYRLSFVVAGKNGFFLGEKFLAKFHDRFDILPADDVTEIEIKDERILISSTRRFPLRTDKKYYTEEQWRKLIETLETWHKSHSE